MYRKNIIYIAVFFIGALILSDIFFTNYNNQIIRESRSIRTKTDTVKMYYDQIAKVVIHSLDLGLRGYAISPNEKIATPMEHARVWKDSIFKNVSTPLKKLGYDVTTLNILKDSVDAYTRYCFRLKDLLKNNDRTSFKTAFDKDKGVALWGIYLSVEKSVLAFLERIDRHALHEYDAAMERNQLIQIILFMLCIPTLLYSAFYNGKTFKLSVLLTKAEADKNALLKEQNERLELTVNERLTEIVLKNEEITVQSEAMIMQNKRLYEAHQLIEKQNEEIQTKNDSLEKQMENRLVDLRNANHELLDHNTQLEQFAFIASHNLRSPCARILGLANLIRLSESEDDKELSLEKMVSAAKDLDAVIKSLSTILDVKKQINIFTEVPLEDAILRVLKMLAKEIEDTGALITYDVVAVSNLYAVAPYIDSILYNLISNAIKYRHLDRAPAISIIAKLKDGYELLIIADNGLGIDIVKHKSDLFSLYKRFHHHVEGKGVGLYLTKTQMTAMGGKIEVDSTPGIGTIFYLFFNRPIAVAKNA